MSPTTAQHVQTELGGRVAAKECESDKRCCKAMHVTAGMARIRGAFPALAEGSGSMIALHRLLASLKMM